MQVCSQTLCLIEILLPGRHRPELAGDGSSEEMQVKLWLPRALLLQLSQQTNAKLKINLLMRSRLSKQLMCARAALHLAVTTQAVPGLCPHAWLEHMMATWLSRPAGWVSLPGVGLGGGGYKLGFQRGQSCVGVGPCRCSTLTPPLQGEEPPRLQTDGTKWVWGTWHWVRSGMAVGH